MNATPVFIGVITDPTVSNTTIQLLGTTTSHPRTPTSTNFLIMLTCIQVYVTTPVYIGRYSHPPYPWTSSILVPTFTTKLIYKVEIRCFSWELTPVEATSIHTIIHHAVPSLPWSPGLYKGLTGSSRKPCPHHYAIPANTRVCSDSDVQNLIWGPQKAGKTNICWEGTNT